MSELEVITAGVKADKRWLTLIEGYKKLCDKDLAVIKNLENRIEQLHAVHERHVNILHTEIERLRNKLSLLKGTPQ